MGAATHPIRIWLDAIWREALARELALTVSEWADRHRIPGWRSTVTAVELFLQSAHDVVHDFLCVAHSAS
jgi:hypothetical protein